MKVGEKWKIVYQDNDYSKICSGEIIENDQFMVEINDIKEGMIGIGKAHIIKAKKLEDNNGFNKH